MDKRDEAAKIIVHYERIAMDLHLNGTYQVLGEARTGLIHMTKDITHAIDHIKEYRAYADDVYGKTGRRLKVMRGLLECVEAELQQLDRAIVVTKEEGAS